MLHPFLFFGRDGVIRTHDPLHPMQVRYQAALRPDKREIIPEQQCVFVMSQSEILALTKTLISTVPESLSVRYGWQTIGQNRQALHPVQHLSLIHI